MTLEQSRRLPARNHFERRVAELGPWFHNLHLGDGRQTAPQHPLGDFPRNKWLQFADSLPADLSGWRALDIGCNAGFYTFALAARGAAVLGIDSSEHYLAQARWAATQLGLGERARFERMQVYDLARGDGSFDLVLFMGVLYHLRYPLLALDVVSAKVGRLLVLQTLTSPGGEPLAQPPNLKLNEREIMRADGWPKLAFIERSLAGDPTNWWAPNDACVEAMLRTTGLAVVERPGHEIYVCRPAADREERQGLLREELSAATGEPGPSRPQ